MAGKADAFSMKMRGYEDGSIKIASRNLVTGIGISLAGVLFISLFAYLVITTPEMGIAFDMYNLNSIMWFSPVIVGVTAFFVGIFVAQSGITVWVQPKAEKFKIIDKKVFSETIQEIPLVTGELILAPAVLDSSPGRQWEGYALTLVLKKRFEIVLARDRDINQLKKYADSILAKCKIFYRVIEE